MSLISVKYKFIDANYASLHVEIEPYRGIVLIWLT